MLSKDCNDTFHPHCLSVMPSVRHCVERVADAHDSRQVGNGVANQTVRVAPTIDALVVATHNRPDRGKDHRSVDQFLPRSRVPAHHRELLVVESTRLRQDLGRHCQFSNVVKQRAETQQVKVAS